MKCNDAFLFGSSLFTLSWKWLTDLSFTGIKQKFTGVKPHLRPHSPAALCSLHPQLRTYHVPHASGCLLLSTVGLLSSNPFWWAVYSHGQWPFMTPESPSGSCYFVDDIELAYGWYAIFFFLLKLWQYSAALKLNGLCDTAQTGWNNSHLAVSRSR